ncbi:IS1096 element passenger TnpR family protein [Geoglobus sp.]
MSSRGRCYICSRVLSKASMTRHLRSHLKNDGETRIFHLRIDASQPEYWLHIEIESDAKLRDLDRFLRDVWLECCGHLSAFEIDGVSYYSDGFDFSLNHGARDMDVSLGEVLSPEMRFHYTYDFGSPTDLTLRVLGVRMGKIHSKVRIIARNEPPDLKCRCGKNAVWVCAVCRDGEDWQSCYLCDDCAGDHECGRGALLPVSNSPRCGVCGYTGNNPQR